jgi:hypothetical protein
MTDVTKVDTTPKVDAQAEQGEAAVEAPRTKRFSIAEGVRKLIREVGAALGLRRLAEAGKESGAPKSETIALGNAAEKANKVTPLFPDGDYKNGIEAATQQDKAA